MTIYELFEIVKDETLKLPQLEKLRDEMIHLHTSMQIRMADLEKAEAKFFIDEGDAETSDISIKRAWRVQLMGQEMITLNREIKAIAKEIDSLKSRVYRLI